MTAPPQSPTPREPVDSTDAGSADDAQSAGAAQPRPRDRRRRRFQRIRRLVGLLQVVVVAALVATATVLISNGSLLQWALNQAQTASGGRLSIESATGSLLGTVQAQRVVWSDAGTTVRLHDLNLEPQWRGLLRGTVQTGRLSMRRLEIEWAPTDAPAGLPESLAVPIRLDLAQVQIDELVIRTEGQPPSLVLRDLSGSIRQDGQRWMIDSLSLRSDLGPLRGSVMLQDQPPFALQGQALLETRLLDEPVAIDARLSGRLQAIDMQVRTTLRAAGVGGKLTVTPFDRHWVSAVDLFCMGLDLARVSPGLPSTRLSGTLKAELPVGERGPGRIANPGRLGVPPLAGRLALDNALPGTFDAGRLPLERLTASLALTGDRLNVAAADLSGAAGSVQAQGTVDLSRPADSFDVRLSTGGLDARGLHTALVATALKGSAHVRPDGRGLLLDADLADALRKLAVRGQARLDDGTLRLAQTRLQLPDGAAEFSGTVATRPPHALQLTGVLDRFDPSRLVEMPPAVLNGPWQLSGELRPQPDLQGQITLTASTWRGLPLSGRASGHFGPGERLTRVDADFAVGSTNLRARGALGDAGDRLEVSAQASRLQELDPRWAGQIGTQLLIGGSLRSPTVSGRLNARDLRIGDQLRAQSVQINGTLPALEALLGELRRAGIDLPAVAAPGPPGAQSDPTLKLAVQAQAVRWGERQAEQISAELTGTAARHAVGLVVQSRQLPLDLSTRLEGGFAPGEPGVWQGRVLEAVQSAAPRARLLAPMNLGFKLKTGSASLGPASVEIDGSDGARLELERAELDPARVRVQGRVTGMPLRWVDRWVTERGVRTRGPEALRLGAHFDVDGQLPAAGPPRWQGQLSLQRESGDLLLEVPAADGGVELLRAGLTQLQARLDLQGDQAVLQADLKGDTLGSASARLTAPLQPDRDGGPLPAVNVPIAGRIDLGVPSLAFTRALVGEAWQLSGALTAGLNVAGTVQSPRVSGTLSGRQLVAVQREFGMRLTDGSLQAEVRDNQIDVQTLRFASGKGSVRMTGSLRPDERSEAVVTLSQMAIPLGAGQRLVVSGESRASFSGGVLRLGGSLKADEGVIEITSGGGPTVSGDVIVVRNAAEAAARRAEALRRSTSGDEAARAARAGAGVTGTAPAGAPADRGFRLISDLAIDLGDRFRVFGAGVDARLTGQVTLTGRLPDSPRLNGTVQIAQGTYTGFGQNLEIERGKLVFSGAVDNPAIDIVAYRRFLPVEAGVAISGTARLPRLTLVSKPDVPEPDKLSWLVLGMSAEASRGGQAAALQAAAALLAAGDPRAAAPSLASTVGLDVLSVRTGASLGGAGSASASVQDTVITLGKRLSERLFVSYEQSLRGLQNLLRLQYEISERLSVRARVGTENAIDLVWTRRYD